MVETNYEYLKEMYLLEALRLCGIDERFDDSSIGVKYIREMYVKIANELINLRDSEGRNEASRNYSIAITALEDSCMRAVKGLYS